MLVTPTGGCVRGICCIAQNETLLAKISGGTQVSFSCQVCDFLIPIRLFPRLMEYFRGNATSVSYVIISFEACHDDVIKWKHFPRYHAALCAGNSPVTGEFSAQRPVTQSFDVFFDLRLNKRLSKQSWGWWTETPSRSLWRHSNENTGETCISLRRLPGQ